jgi:hypothetical protein
VSDQFSGVEEQSHKRPRIQTFLQLAKQSQCDFPENDGTTQLEKSGVAENESDEMRQARFDKK